MSKLFSVRHPAKSEAYNWEIGCRYWQFLACNRDVKKAILLSHFIKLQESLIDLSYSSKSQTNKSYYIENSSKVLFKVNLSELREALFGLASEKTLSKALDGLVELGFISLHADPNPNIEPGTPPSRAKFICLHPVVCNEWIDANYNQDGSLKNPQNHQTVKTQNGPNGKTSEWGITHQTVKLLNGPCGKITEWKKRQGGSQQPIENTENQLESSPNGKTSEWPYIYNQSIQSTNSINKNEKISYLEKNETAKSSDQLQGIEVVIETLVELGLSPEKLNYPDAMPTIERLIQSGASNEIFKQAYENSSQATQGKGFGMNYLARAVESVLKKNKDASPKKTKFSKKSEVIKPVQADRKREYVYKNDLTNAKSWAGDLI